MLRALSIRNVVLIDRLDLEFRPGLSALTGETGAGKSILLDALGLAIGARAEAGLVRAGADQADVTAEFSVPTDHPVFAILNEASFATEDAIVLRRILSADGRSRAFIDDRPVSVGFLKQAGEALVDIHGQFETHALFDPAAHRTLLDAYAGLGDATARRWTEWQEARETLERLRREAEDSRAAEADLRIALDDLAALDPQAGEEDTLLAQRERLAHRDKILQGLSAADTALAEDDSLRRAMAALGRIAERLGPEGEAILSALDRATQETQDAAARIQSLSADMQDSDKTLESVDDRLHELRALARRHRCTTADLPGLRETLAARLDTIARGDGALKKHVQNESRTRKAYIDAAQKDRAARQKYARTLDKAVMQELPPLKMDGARFVTSVEDLPEAEWSAGGTDRVRFLIAANPGASPAPLHKAASGGEAARLMLALKVVMSGGADTGQTLIFDEADSGIGGAAADAVGERLARLAGSRQVLAVTHSPQVAARADHHYTVRKSGKTNARTEVAELEPGRERREEIARMLAGAVITDAARAAAESLLKTGT